MIADWFVTMVDREGFVVRVHSGDRETFEVSSDDPRLQRQAAVEPSPYHPIP